MYDSSRRAPRVRAATLWLAVTATALALGRLAVPAVTTPGAGPATFADLLVAGSGALAVLSLAWLWLVTTTVVADVLRAPSRPLGPAGPLRRALLAACGVAVLSAGAQPAAGEPGPGVPAPVGVRADHPLDGLPLPDRATGGHRPPAVVRRQPAPPRPHTVTVRAGDSLWSIAGAALGPGADVAEIAAYWPLIHRANRAVVGADPHLIHPGQRLGLPAYPTPRGGTS